MGSARSNSAPFAGTPLLPLVAVCATTSLLSKTTVVPAATERSFPNDRFAMVTVAVGPLAAALAGALAGALAAALADELGAALADPDTEGAAVATAPGVCPETTA